MLHGQQFAAGVGPWFVVGHGVFDDPGRALRIGVIEVEERAVGGECDAEQALLVAVTADFGADVEHGRRPAGDADHPPRLFGDVEGVVAGAGGQRGG